MNEKRYQKTKMIALLVPVVGTVFIALMDVIIILLIGVGAGNFKAEQCISSAIVANGLSVIAIVASVWIGINVYNIIEKRELNELYHKFSKANKKLGNLQKEIKNMDVSVIDYKKISNNIKEINRQQFINQMYKIKDPSCDYFAKKFEQESTLEMQRYLELIIIDILMERVYIAHYRYHTEEYNQIIYLAQAGIKRIKLYRAKYKERTALEDQHLSYREGDFWFYMGYCLTGKNRYNAFKIASEKFIYVAKKQDIALSLEDGNVDLLHFNNNSKTMEMSVYFMNAIGECYSMMITALTEMGERNTKKYKKIQQQAFQYFQFVEKSSEWGCEREVYYRNYGGMLEKSCKNIDNLKKAADLYQKAFEIEKVKSQSYHAIISNKNNLIKKFLGIVDRTPGNKRKDSLLDINLQKCQNVDLVRSEIAEMRIYVSIAIQLFSNEAKWYAFSIYQKLFACILQITQWEEELQSMQEDINYIRILRGNTNLCKVAIEEVEDLREELYRRHEGNCAFVAESAVGEETPENP